MRIARARTPDGVISGEYDDGTIVGDDGRYEIGAEAELLAPTEPSALYCMGRNFQDAIDEKGYDRPDEPDFFIKPPVSVHPPDSAIEYPSFSSEVTYAGELAAVVGTRCKNVAPEDVSDVVAGYTIMNDLDALDQQRRTARKAFDQSAPLGPWIETSVDPTSLDMRTEINGEVRQSSATDAMLFDPDEAISFISERVTLREGDVVAMGSPGNPGVVEPGDEIEIWYENVGTLRNTVE